MVECEVCKRIVESLITGKCVRCYKREWRENNKDKIIERRRTYYQENKDILAEKGKLWQEENKDRWNEIQRKSIQKRNKNLTCNILKAHHEELKDDPERLSTDFINQLIGTKCNVEDDSDE